MTWWERFLDRHGWPTVLVFITGIGLFNFLSWLKPKVDKLLDNHFDTVQSLTTTQAAQVENGKKLIGIAESEVQKTNEILTKVEDVHRAIVREKPPKGD